MQNVVVAVLTYRRNADLLHLLPELARQAALCTPAATVLVIDNDPGAGARAAVAEFGRSVRYVHEPVPGIAAGRNRALDEAGAEDLLVFIDDDEMPSEGWLKLLLETYASSDADAVTGRVDREFRPPLEPWLLQGGYFPRHTRATGTLMDAAATNNLLLDMRTVHRMGLRFDPEFGLSGGSDTMFTRQFVARGGVIVWNDEAVVTDRVPVSRITRRWAITRSFRSGNAWGRTSVHLARTPGERLKARAAGAALGGGRTVGGVAQAAWGTLCRSMRSQAQGVRRAARGAGMFSGALGYVYVEYRRDGDEGRLVRMWQRRGPARRAARSSD